MPTRPRCISRTHKYTDMWKYFDRGLYEFIFTYIYIELSPKNATFWRRLGAVFVTFAFIYIWHGMSMTICIWATLNFSCVIAENILSAFTNSGVYKSWINRYLNPMWELRLNSLLAANILLPSILSNFIFLGTTNVGKFFFIRTYTSGFQFYATLLMTIYAIYNVGEWLSRKIDLPQKHHKMKENIQ